MTELSRVERGHGPAEGPPDTSGREQAVAAIFSEHHTPLVRLSTLLGADDPEDIVGEAFYQLFRRWRRLRDTESAVAYLRSVVCNLTRMRIRHLQVARKHLLRSGADPTSANIVELDGTGLRDDQRELLEALKELPTRQREALVLRYWLDLREVEIADTMGISAGAVKSHASRGMTTLNKILQRRQAEAPTVHSPHTGTVAPYSGTQKQTRRARGR